MPYSIDYLKAHSNLPGPRANLELLYQFISNASKQEIENCLSFEDDDPSREFVLMCGVAAQIKNAAMKTGQINLDLSRYTNHENWRVRESVCIGFQRSKEYIRPSDMMLCLRGLKEGTALDVRAYFATLCDPLLLIDYIDPVPVLKDLEEITITYFNNDEKLTDALKVLRKALGYCWSVAICAEEENGKQLFESLLDYKDSKHILWILKENLKKNRLKKLEGHWLERMNESISN